ncbi:hypothetical protein [Streptomyces sp. NPDC020489]|uniref:hypothetical protein n=1 Tax=Streptomyces sp. NPDC020489 TaxID=3365077 RepID=UPI0037902738
MTDESDEQGLAGRVHALSKRNLLIVVVLFLSSIVTAVSTLATAWGVLRKQTMDWRPAEYRKLQSLRGGHTIERFTSVLGNASYRAPFVEFAPVPGQDTSKLTKHVFRPREEYRVEVITAPGGSTLVYAVTSCDPDFKPSFEVNRLSEKRRFTVTLGMRLADVRPSDSTFRQFMTQTGERYTAVYQSEISDGSDGRRGYAWGSNDVCPLTTEDERRRSDAIWSRWEKWQLGRDRDDVGVVSGDRSDPSTRNLMERSSVNVYAETTPDSQIDWYYPALIGVDRRYAD